jgi:hypothetical protein
MQLSHRQPQTDTFNTAFSRAFRPAKHLAILTGAIGLPAQSSTVMSEAPDIASAIGRPPERGDLQELPRRGKPMFPSSSFLSPQREDVSYAAKVTTIIFSPDKV